MSSFNGTYKHNINIMTLQDVTGTKQTRITNNKHMKIALLIYVWKTVAKPADTTKYSMTYNTRREQPMLFPP